METLDQNTNDLLINDDGFLTDINAWDEKVAHELARHQGLDDLDSEQIEIIKTLRNHYLKYDSFPILASICKKVGSQTRDCVSRKFDNPMTAWKIAGLPKPPNVFFTSFDGKKYIPNPFY